MRSGPNIKKQAIRPDQDNKYFLVSYTGADYRTDKRLLTTSNSTVYANKRKAAWHYLRIDFKGKFTCNLHVQNDVIHKVR
jgi:hypothetical protein